MTAVDFIELYDDTRIELLSVATQEIVEVDLGIPGSYRLIEQLLAAATPADVPDTVVRRSENGAVAIARVDLSNPPDQPYHATRKDYVDSRIWQGTQAEFDALPVKDDTVLYVIRP